MRSFNTLYAKSASPVYTDVGQLNKGVIMTVESETALLKSYVKFHISHKPFFKAVI
jgi:hypothetical protein